MYLLGIPLTLQNILPRLLRQAFINPVVREGCVYSLSKSWINCRCVRLCQMSARMDSRSLLFTNVGTCTIMLQLLVLFVFKLAYRLL